MLVLTMTTIMKIQYTLDSPALPTTHNVRAFLLSNIDARDSVKHIDLAQNVRKFVFG